MAAAAARSDGRARAGRRPAATAGAARARRVDAQVGDAAAAVPPGRAMAVQHRLGRPRCPGGAGRRSAPRGVPPAAVCSNPWAWSTPGSGRRTSSGSARATPRTRRQASVWCTTRRTASGHLPRRSRPVAEASCRRSTTTTPSPACCWPEGDWTTDTSLLSPASVEAMTVDHVGGAGPSVRRFAGLGVRRRRPAATHRAGTRRRQLRMGRRPRLVVGQRSRKWAHRHRPDDGRVHQPLTPTADHPGLLDLRLRGTPLTLGFGSQARWSPRLSVLLRFGVSPALRWAVR